MNNILGNVKSNPLLYFYPEHVDDILEIILEAEEKGYRVRAVGSGHSFSEAAKGDEFMMDMKKLRNIERYRTPLVKAPLASNEYVLVDAGTTIKRTNRKLDELGLALMNMGAVDFQTVSGALLTGTHGSGIKMPAFLIWSGQFDWWKKC
jgi:FAD/FMN-containing dehydrogenase